MQLVYLVHIFEDNYNIVRDRFETRFSKREKKGHLFQRNNGNFNIYKLGAVISENHENCH